MDTKKLTLIQVNDIHGHLEPHHEIFFEHDGIKIKEAGGYSRIKTLVNNIRRENPNSIFLDCGDTFHGTYITTQTQGEAIVPLLNAMGFDMMTAHWDFAYTPAHLKKLANSLNYPLLSANTYIYDESERLFEPYVIKELDGLKIGIFGMACEHVVQGFPKKFSEGIYMSPVYDEVPKIVSELKLKHKVDIIVFLSHLGLPTDYELLSRLSGVDVCISGHTHNRLAQPIEVGGAILIQSGVHGSFVGRLDLEIVNGKVVQYHHELIVVDETIEKNAEVEAIIQHLYEPHVTRLNEVVGQTNTILFRGLSANSTMDEFLLKSIAHVTGNKVCFSHGWRYGTPIIKGEITLKDLYNIVPMNPKIIMVEMKGFEIRELIENQLEATYSKNPYGQTGGFIQRVLGIKAYILIENPKGHRVQTLFIEGKPCDSQKTYQVSYITEQGVPKYLGSNRVTLEMTAIEAMRNYLKVVGTYDEKPEEYFVII